MQPAQQEAFELGAENAFIQEQNEAHFTLPGSVQMHLQTPSYQILEATDETADTKTTGLCGLSTILILGLHCTSKYSGRDQEGHKPEI